MAERRNGGTAELVEIVLAERQYRSNGYLSTSFMVHADDDDDTTLIIYYRLVS
jgi:hypothetical protein